MKILVTDRAKGDLLRLYLYLAERNPRSADAIVEAIAIKFEHLSRFPFIGRDRSVLAPGLRSLVVGNLLIFYTVEQDRIIVVRVIDGRMDIDEEFQR